MKTISIRFLLLFGSIFLFFGCDKIEGPYFKEDNTVNTTVEFPEVNPDTLIRKILIEEYTAQQCQNCPTQGHLPLAQLLETYGNKLVAVCIHAGSLARPDLIPPFDYDFRTELGDVLYNDYVIAGGSGIPCAVVNRTRYNNVFPLANNNWEAAIQSIDTQLYAGIQIINEYDNNILTTHLKSSFYKNYSNKVILSVILIEDSFISPQLDGSTTIENYTHNHVLRTSLNGIQGSYLNESGFVEKDSSYVKSYQLNFTDHDWTKANCSIIAILYDETTQEILQTEISPL